MHVILRIWFTTFNQFYFYIMLRRPVHHSIKSIFSPTTHRTVHHSIAFYFDFRPHSNLNTPPREDFLLLLKSSLLSERAVPRIPASAGSPHAQEVL